MGIQDNADSREDWNEKIYAALEKDIDVLKKQKVKIVLYGDFNGYISNDEQGIIGNHFGTNINGRRLIEFAMRNNLKNTNTKKIDRSGKSTNLSGRWVVNQTETGFDG